MIAVFNQIALSDLVEHNRREIAASVPRSGNIYPPAVLFSAPWQKI
jgi:hypothetical protein